jgi:2-keto-4-pentenoate hydratase
MPDHETVAGDLLRAFETGEPLAPLTETYPGIDVDAAYAIQTHLIAKHAAAGRHVAGRKIGLTSAAIQQQLGVDSPDFGVVLSSHVFQSGAAMSRSAMTTLLPRLEAEVAFILVEPLAGPGVTAERVLAATQAVLPVFELIDSRIRDWKITLADTVADNASALGAVWGAEVPLHKVGPLDALEVRITRDGELIQSGRGDAVMGHPAEAVAWLANELGRRGDALPAGSPVLSGSFTAAFDAAPGHYVADFGAALGAVDVTVTP